MIDFIINAIGTSAFALAGYIVGIRKRLDILGIMMCAFSTAIGGGMTRDVLVGRLPRVFLEYSSLVIIIITIILAVIFNIHNLKKQLAIKLFVWSDSLGLVSFSIMGAQVGLDYDLNLFGVIILAFATAVGGGIWRDMLVRDIPVVMREDFYASVAIIVAALIYVLDYFAWINIFTINVLLISGYLLRMWAYNIGLKLPQIPKSKKDQKSF